uniref:Putative secreted protein n=1 Tax=Rhipicephalus microplus TaxID=6941 RepID=A0A6G5A1T2_RHIMP
MYLFLRNTQYLRNTDFVLLMLFKLAQTRVLSWTTSCHQSIISLVYYRARPYGAQKAQKFLRYSQVHERTYKGI